MFNGLRWLARVVGAACLTFSPVIWADAGTQVYTGTLGKMPIVLVVNTNNGEGRYFYQKYRQDLYLSGFKEGETLVMDEGEDEDEPRPKIRLQPKAEGWSGEWTSPKGKVLKIELQAARIPPVPAGTLPYLAQLPDTSPYEYLRLQGLKLKKGQIQNFMGYSLQWWSEPQSNTALFEVVSGYTPEVRQRINQQLMAGLWRGVVEYFGCTVHGAVGSYSQISQPMWMSPSVMSIVTSSDYYCGGAYPDQNNEALSFDAKTGKILTLDDVLWVGQGKPLHDEYNSDGSLSTALNEYRTQELAPWLAAQMLKLYPREMTAKPEVEHNDCHYDDDSRWGHPGWYFTEKGLKLEPYYPHVAAVCRYIDWGVLPYTIVKQHPGEVTLQLP